MKRLRRRSKQYITISKFLHEKERERERERERENERGKTRKKQKR